MFEIVPSAGLLSQSGGQVVLGLLPLSRSRVAYRLLHQEATQVKAPELMMEDRSVPAGLLGRYYAARHSHGQYRSCAVTGRYNFSLRGLHQPEKHIIDVLKFSLSKTIERHPSLCYGLAEKTENEDAKFIRLTDIQLEDVLELSSSQEADRDATLTGQLGLGHQRLFTNPYQKPAWRLSGLLHKKTVDDGFLSVDLSFFAHHAIADGISAGAFHRTLSEHLFQTSRTSDLNTEWPFYVPSTTPAPRPIEQAFQFPAQHPDLPFKTGLSTIPGPDAWTANPPSLPTLADMTSQVVFITIAPANLTRLLKNCHSHGITLTGLLHSLIIIYLSRSLHQAKAFKGVTPYSMRRFTNISDAEIANHISYITSNFNDPILTASRAAWENSVEEAKLIRKISKGFHKEIMDELTEVPVKGSPALNDIAKIQDMDEFCENGMKGKRPTTYELSNIGTVDIPEAPKDAEVTLEKLVFTQCGMVAGPAFGCSVVSTKGGNLVVSLHWQEGIVEGDIMEGLKAYLERRLNGFGDAKESKL